MTNRLDDKIRAFVLELVDDPPPAPEIDFEVGRGPAPSQLHQVPARPRSMGRGVAIVGAALLVLAAVGLPVFLFSGGNSAVMDTTVPTTEPPITSTLPPTTEPPATTVAAAPTTTTTPPPVLPPSTTWERIESQTFDPGHIWAVAGSDETIVAVGEVVSNPVDSVDADVPSGVIWASNDAVEWTRIDDPETFGRRAGATIVWDVVVGPTGFVASGQDGPNSVLWFSADGYTWQRVFDEDLGTPGDIEDLAVASGGPGWIAAAIDWGPISSPTGVYLTSTDGIDWVTVSDPEEAAILDAELRPLGHEWRSPYAFPAAASERMPVTAAPTGGNGAWDYAWNGDQVMAVARNTVPEIWGSPDAGLTWYRVDHEQWAIDGETLGVEFFDGRYVVVGAAPEAAMVWHCSWLESQEG